MATQKEIAEKLNISQQAVSASLGSKRGTVKVAPETREMVLKAAKQFGYVPNQMARSLKSGRTGMIGVLMPFCKDPYYSALIDALNIAAIRRKYSLLLQFHLWSSGDEELAFRRLIGARVEGILSYPRSENYRDTSLAALIKSTRIPVVALSAKADQDLYAGVVEKDYEAEGRILGEELLREGHRNIDILAISSDHMIQHRRMQGIVLAIEKSGLRASARHVNLPAESQPPAKPADPVSDAQRNQVVEDLARYYVGFPGRGSAVIVGNEAVAWKVMSVATEKGLQIPRDLSVVCSGTSGEGATGPVPLTAVEYDVSAIATHAMDLLLNKGGARISVAPRLVRRNSVGSFSPDLIPNDHRVLAPRDRRIRPPGPASAKK